MKRCSTSLFIGEMQIKTTMRYHLAPFRMPIIKKPTNNKCWRLCGKKGTLVLCWWECKLVQPLWKTVWRLYGYIPIKVKTLIQKDTCTSVFIVTLLRTAKTQEQPTCPSTYDWIKKMWYIYIKWNTSHKKV